MKNDKKIALFDMDGTLADYEGQLLGDLRSMKSPGEPEPTLSWKDTPTWLENRMHFIKSQPGWWRNLPCLQSGFSILSVAKAVGFDIHILTKGPRTTHSAWTEKLLWCQGNIGPDTDVTITFDKGLVYGRVLVDDYPEYMDRWLKNRPRGIGIMPSTEYNKEYDHPRVVRYSNPDDLSKVRAAMIGAFDR